VVRRILAADGRAFTDREAAAYKAAVLSREVGVAFAVIEHPDGGYAVAPVAEPELGGDAVSLPLNNGSIAAAHPLSAPPQRPRPDQGDPTDTAPPVLRLSPAPRAFLGYHALTALGAVLMVQPQRVLALLLGDLGRTSDPQVNATLVLILMLGGLGLALYALGAFAWGYASHRYTVTADTVSAERGIIARTRARVAIAHIRTVDVHQSVLERLLDVGHVSLATAGTGGYDLILWRVARPLALQETLQRRARRVRTAPER
jgi:membrane protein YdbS with pleckstrin-like domain